MEALNTLLSERIDYIHAFRNAQPMLKHAIIVPAAPIIVPAKNSHKLISYALLAGGIIILVVVVKQQLKKEEENKKTNYQNRY